MNPWNQSWREHSPRGENDAAFPFWPSDQIVPRSSENRQRSDRKRRVILSFLACAALLSGGIMIGVNAGTGNTSTEVETIASFPMSSPIVGDSVEPVAAVAEAVGPSVVRIDTATGTGSGIIFDETGVVVTNAHVVQGEESVEIQLADGTRATGLILGADPNVDIALVQIQGSLTFKKATFATLETVRVGQLAVAIGSPFGLEQSVTAGIVSAINRAVTTENIYDGSIAVVEMIQTDAPINPGNSGGALVDRQGRVVGMNTLIRTDGVVEGNIGVGFAIPTDTIFLVAERITNGESLESGFLGISGQNPTLGRAGALVISVVMGSPADSAGLETGDLIIAVDDAPILGMSELAARIRLSSPGTTLEVTVLRNGEQMTFTVVLAALGRFD